MVSWSCGLLLRRSAHLVCARSKEVVIHRIIPREDLVLGNPQPGEVAFVRGAADEGSVELADDLALDPLRLQMSKGKG